VSGKILFVDDDPNILRCLKRLLQSHHLEWGLHFAGDVDEALDLLHQYELDLLVSDVSMPGKDGFDLLTAVREDDRTADLPVLMLTGNDAADLKRRSLKLGATDLLNKPIIREDLVARIESMLRIKFHQDQIKQQNAVLEQKVRERTAEIEAARIDLIWRLGKAAEYRDTDTGNHVIRVGHYCRTLAKRYGKDDSFSDMIFLTGPLHDIGKIGIPDRVLLKQGKLDAQEWEIMKRHCRIGARILQQDLSLPSGLDARTNALLSSVRCRNPFLEAAASIALNHHEWWDGRGYPQGLTGEEIPLEARIAAIADVYDALSSNRPYKPGFPEEKVLRIMQEKRGSHFDPVLFDCFVSCLDHFRDIRNHFADQAPVCSSECWRYKEIEWRKSHTSVSFG